MISDFDNYTEEFDIEYPVRFVTATRYDIEGKEIERPHCHKCGQLKSAIMSRDYYAWVCMLCGVE